MAIINNTFKFVFIHVPKAAGTSVTNNFSQYSNFCDLEIGGTSFGENIQPYYRNRFGLSKHIPAVELKNMLGQKAWSRYFTFSIVRNPVDRLLSIFNFLKQWEGTPSDLRGILKEFSSFDEFVMSEIWKKRPGPDNMFFPQTHWLCYKGELLVDYVGKLEDLDNSIEKIKFLAGVSSKHNSEFKRLNESDGDKDFSNISKKSKLLINEFYESDFNFFGYEKLNED